MYAYTFQIYLRSQLRMYWCYFFPSVHNMFRPLRAIFRWNIITSLTTSVVISMAFSRYVSEVIVFRLKMEPKHVVNRGEKIKPINSQLRSQVYLKGIRLPNPSDRIRPWGLRASNRNEYQKQKMFLGRKVWPVRRTDNLTAICEPIV
jgi:hypothetical protein